MFDGVVEVFEMTMRLIQSAVQLIEAARQVKHLFDEAKRIRKDNPVLAGIVERKAKQAEAALRKRARAGGIARVRAKRAPRDSQGRFA